jgi:hypothetical protein
MPRIIAGRLDRQNAGLWHESRQFFSRTKSAFVGAILQVP